jgi:hypothetical protein
MLMGMDHELLMMPEVRLHALVMTARCLRRVQPLLTIEPMVKARVSMIPLMLVAKIFLT